MMKIEKIEASNGEFAICPRCGRTMAKGLHGHGIMWTCLFGCDLQFLELSEYFYKGGIK